MLFSTLKFSLCKVKNIECFTHRHLLTIKPQFACTNVFERMTRTMIRNFCTLINKLFSTTIYKMLDFGYDSHYKFKVLALVQRSSTVS